MRVYIRPWFIRTVGRADTAERFPQPCITGGGVEKCALRVATVACVRACPPGCPGIMGHVDSGKTSLARALSTTISTAGLDKHPQSQVGLHEVTASV